MADRRRTTAAELTAPTGKLSKDMRRAERIVGKSTAKMQRDLGRVQPQGGRAGGAVAAGTRQSRLTGAVGGGRVGGMMTQAMAFGGVYGIQAEMRNAKAYEETLVDLAVRGGKSRKWLDGLRGSIKAASNEYGVGKEQIAEYVGTIIDQTGNTKLATDTLRDMTAVAYSANVPMGELAGTVVEMQSKLALAPKEFKLALGVLAAQADKGKVPLSQMSKYLPEVLNATTQFGHTGVGALRDYGAVLQMAARGAGSLAEANTAMNRMLDQTAAKRGKIEKALNIKLKKNGAWLQLAPMLKEIVAGLIRMKSKGKDVEKFIVKTWGIRGKKAILPMLQQGMMGWDSRVGSKGGKGGLTSFNALIGAGDVGTIDRRVAHKRSLAPDLDKWNRSVERLKNQLHQHLLPALKMLGDSMPGIGGALTAFIKNWHVLIGIWASDKMRQFFANWNGGGGGPGGGPGGGGMGGGDAGGSRRRGGRLARGGVAAAGLLEGVLTGKFLAQTGLNAFDPKSASKALGWKNADLLFGSDEIFNLDLSKQAKAEGLHKRRGYGSKFWKRKFASYGKTKRGQALQGDIESTRIDVQSAIESGSPEAIKAAMGQLTRVATRAEVARREIASGHKIYNPKTGKMESGTRQAEMNWQALSPVQREQKGMGGFGELIVMLKQMKAVLSHLQQNGVRATLIDPNKTPAGVTQSRKGKKR